ncbi:hypothetical protein ACP70R_038216 [Stipagrostis hirtigluma subsp. patula]
MAEDEKADEVGEYESDPDDAPRLAVRRRASASDDEEEEDDGGGGGRGSTPPSTVFDSESESDPDGQGAAELYDDGEEVYGTEEDEECQDVYEEVEAGGGGEAKVVTGEVAVAPATEDEGKYEEEEEDPTVGTEEEAEMEGEEKAAMEGEEDTEKKGGAPYDVPTTGAFYMHDNRFQDQENGGRGYQRHNFGGQKLWYSKDEAGWVHDRFYEINFHDNASIKHSVGHGYSGATKCYDDTRSFDNVQIQSRSYGNAKVYNNEPNVYGEKVSRSYQAHWTTSGVSSAQMNRKSFSRSQNAEAVGKHSSQTLDLQHEQNLHCKQSVGSSISSAPPPFCSSRSSHQELKPRLVRFSKLFSSAVHMAHNSLTPQSRRKAFVPSGEHGNVVDSCCVVPIEIMPCSALDSISTSNNYSEYPKSWGQGGDSHIAEPAHNTVSMSTSNNYSEATRLYTQAHNAGYQQWSVQPSILPIPRASAQIFGEKFTSTEKIQSHPETTLISKAEDGEATTPPEQNNLVVLSEVEGQDDMKEAERASLPDGGGHVLGITGTRDFSLGDPMSIGASAKLPVMQFGGQYLRGPGFPSVPIVRPGFMGQQSGGSSEMGLMTWLPISTNATGVLEGTLSPPYFGSYCPQPSELASPSVSARDHGATEAPVSLTSQEIPEVVIVGHEPVHRRNSSRRLILGDELCPLSSRHLKWIQRTSFQSTELAQSIGRLLNYIATQLSVFLRPSPDSL